MKQEAIIPRNVITQKVEVELDMFAKEVTVTPDQLPHYILGILLLYYILSPQYVALLYIYKAMLSIAIAIMTMIFTQYKKHGLTIGESIDIYIQYLIKKLRKRGER